MGQGMRSVTRLARELLGHGLHVEVALTPEERSSLVHLAARDARCHCLVAVGGDGTVSALVNERPTVPISVLPAGTENLVARHFGLGRDAAALARSIALDRRIRVDLGQTAGRRFVLMAGFGFDGDIVTRHHNARISATGSVRSTNRVAYFEPILRSSLSYRFPWITVRVADPGGEEVLTGTSVFLFNLPRYALGLPFVPEATEDDGMLDLLVFRDAGPFQALYYLWKVLCGSHLDEPGVFHRRVRKVIVAADEPVPAQLDGDPGGYLVPSVSTPDTGGQTAGRDSGPRAPDDDSLLPDDRVAGGWTVEILPGALQLIAGEQHHGGAAAHRRSRQRIGEMDRPETKL
jgi:diacylglycerol kinase family enzyme